MASERRKKLVLTAVSALVTLLFAEAALRIAGVGAAGQGSPWFAGGNHPRLLFQPDTASGYTLRPGFHGRQVAPRREFDVATVVDRRGLRDHPHTAPAAPSVLAIGDSMTFGEGVPVEQTYSAVLEKTSGVRVYNGGVPGYGSRQMLGRLEKLLPQVRPSLVTEAVSPLWDAQRCATPFVYKEGYIVAQGYVDRLYLVGDNLYSAETKLPLLGPATAYLKGRSNLMRLALPALAGGARRALGGKQEAPVPDPRPSAEALSEAHRKAESAGADFLVILLDGDSRGEEYRQARAALESELQARGIPFISLDRLLPKADWPRLRYAQDGHWNADGHRAVGTALAPRVLRYSRTSRRGDV
ncbi:MAG TPA: hypothetical protein VMW27_05980 [Thermoanaerobaculia bacterium]|nr:hypothetical protein [Thermoanaerobaculia bacterium]